MGYDTLSNGLYGVFKLRRCEHACETTSALVLGLRSVTQATAVPFQARRALGGSRRLRLPEVRDSRHTRVVMLTLSA